MNAIPTMDVNINVLIHSDHSNVRALPDIIPRVLVFATVGFQFCALIVVGHKLFPI